MKEFRVDDELPFNTVDYLNIDTAIEELAALEAVAEAARTGRGLDDALDALDALKGAE